MGLSLNDILDTEKTYESDFEGGFKSLKDGWYEVTVLKSELRESNAGNVGLSHEYEVVDCPGGYSKYLKNWFNLTHAKDEVVRIAQEQFHSARVAIGQPKLSEPGAFEGRNMMVKVKKTKASEKELENGWCNDDGFRNSVCGWKMCEDNEAPFFADKEESRPAKKNEKSGEPTFNWQKKG